MPRRLFLFNKESFAYYNFAHIYDGHLAAFLAFLFKMCKYVHWGSNIRSFQNIPHERHLSWKNLRSSRKDMNVSNMSWR